MHLALAALAALDAPRSSGTMAVNVATTRQERFLPPVYVSGWVKASPIHPAKLDEWARRRRRAAQGKRGKRARQ